MEQPLPANSACTLSSINLGEFVVNPFTDSAYFDYVNFNQMVEEGIVYLNDLLDESTRQHPLKAQRDSVAHYRQIGLGFFGLADALIKLGIRYGDEESLKFIDMIGAMSVQAALHQSALLAKGYGAAPAYSEKVMESAFFKEHANKNTIKLVKEYGLRNTQLLTVAPK